MPNIIINILCISFVRCSIRNKHFFPKYYLRYIYVMILRTSLKINIYYPIHYYCYAGIINSLEKLVQKSSFPERCEEWRTRGHIEGDLMMFAPLIISGAINYIWRQNKTITTCPSLRKALHHGPNSKESSLTHSHL